MALGDVAKLIPAAERRVILEHDFIGKSRAHYQDYAMRYLLMIWKEYVEPGLDSGCGSCINRVRHNFLELEKTFLDLQKQDNLLDTSK